LRIWNLMLTSLKLARFRGLTSNEASMRIGTRDAILAGVAVLLAGIASGCSQSTRSQPPAAALAPIPQPVAPAPAARSSQTVKASYYGDEFRGHRTASGERYDPNQLTAASKKLPIGSLVHVTNPDNGRSVVVRINDHGPYVRGRSLDLSKAAARRLGLTRKGVGRVKIMRIHSRPKSRSAAPTEEANSAERAHVLPTTLNSKLTEASAVPDTTQSKPVETAVVPATVQSTPAGPAATSPPKTTESAYAVQ
jgi:rare lipoprotein A